MVIIFSILSGILYRLGGIGKSFRFWMRDWTIPFVIYGLLITYKHPANTLGWLMFLPTIALTGGALSTYWDFLFKNEDNYYMHGFMIGLACLPLFWIGLHWWAILLRAVICALGMGIWSKLIDDVNLEEGGRGFITCATIPLLLL
jgi:hypothetical protein